MCAFDYFVSIQFKFDATEFQKQFRERVARSKRTLPEICNHTAYIIAGIAFKRMKKAHRSEIEKLGVAGYRVFAKSGKRLKNRKILYNTAGPMRSIYVAGLRAKGIDPRSMKPGEISANVIKALSARLKSIGFLAVGLLPIIKKFAYATGNKPEAGGDVKQKGRAKGSATVAKDGWAPTAQFEHGSLTTKGQTSAASSRAVEYASDAIGRAFDEQAREWESYAAKKLNESLHNP